MLSYHADFVMADPAQLRKCEELLGKLPERPASRGRNPVWVFLRGIEGFDAERASECLVKLLDKHYDTVAVLKLATKRDLVEDAGILPGDALRIVAAAKDYVAPPPDADHSAESVPENGASKPGDGFVEHHQHACQPPAPREKTVIFTPSVTSQASTHAYFPPVIQENKAEKVAQESWKTEEQVAVNRQETDAYVEEVEAVNQSAVPKQEAVKAVNQAAPKHTKDALAAKDSYPVIPIPKDITYPHTCGMCNVKCNSEITCSMHYNGRTHRVKLAEVSEEVEEAKKRAQAQAVPSHACGVCNVKCGSEVDIRSHFNGRKHARNMELAADSDDNSPTPFLHCSVCDVNSVCKRNLVMHLNGKRHAQNMRKGESDSGDGSHYSDSESDY